MKGYCQLALMILIISPLHADTIPTAFKPAPTRPSMEANVIVEEQEILDTCEPEKICVQGRLHNNGSQTAYQLKLHVEIGGTKQGRPRHVLTQKVDSSSMAPGDQQEFYLTIDRKITLKDNKGEEKVLEVGKYNFKIVPVWTVNKPKPPAPKKRKH